MKFLQDGADRGDGDFALGLLHSDPRGPTEVEERCARKKPREMHLLGYLYWSGQAKIDEYDEQVQRSLFKKFEVGLELLRESAEAGYQLSLVFLGILYDQNSPLIERDVNKWRYYLRKLAKTGDPNGLYELGKVIVKEQIGGEETSEEGVKLTIEAASKGHIDAQITYAGYLKDGELVERDEKKAMSIYKQIAESSIHNEIPHCLAITNYGYACRDGLGGIEKNPVKSVHLLKISADRGDTRALRLLATAYVNGNGVKQDKVEAFQFVKRASELGALF